MGINLAKGQKINLSKNDGSTLHTVSLGMNWGAIQETVTVGGLFGIGGKKVTKTEAVDLDASCAVFDENNNLMDVICFHKLRNAWISHSGDDRTGDTDGDDGEDNEIITVNLDKAPDNAKYAVFFLNSFQQHDFAKVPFATIRIYEGSPRSNVKNDSVLASFNVSGDSRFAGRVSMVMGRLSKNNGKWEFSSIGEATSDKRLNETVETIRKQYLV